MTFDPFYDPVEDINGAVNDFTDNKTWTQVRDANLGKNQTPPVIVVPVSERIAPGAMYFYEGATDNPTIGQAINTDAALTYDNAIPGTPIEVGYPPGERHFLHMRLRAKALIFTGGALPSQIQAKQNSSVVPQKWQELRVIDSESLTPGITDGKFRIGDTIIKGQNITMPDLTSYVPAPSNTAVWVLLSIDENLDVEVTAGDEFSTGIAGNHTYQPTAVPGGYQQLAWVKLTNGDTTISIIVNCHMIPSAAGGASDFNRIAVVNAEVATFNGNVAWI